VNLLLDPWIALRRRSGAIETVAPWQINDRHAEDPFAGFASPRADFDGALAQFLIGLLQTTLPPARSREWRQRFNAPPSSEDLRQAFQPLAFAFELFGDGPRFLQDLTLENEEHGEEAIERLLVEAPGENTLRQGKDHFVKAGRIDALCPACAAAALLTLQVNAPSGGQGHRTGLRGGGPLTTLVEHPGDLWATLWLNVLTPSDIEGETEGKDRPEDRFPWLAPTRTSEKGGRETTLADVHPMQMFWAMPRRIRLRPEPEISSNDAACSLCAGAGQPLVRTFLNRNFGVNYAGSWRHPLSPHRKKEDGLLLPVHGDPAGLSYRNWLGLVQSHPEDNIQPAAVVEALRRDDDRREHAEAARCRLWACGYDMDNMKARSWLDGRIPLLFVRPEHRKAFELEVERLVLSAAESARALVFAAKQAVTDRPKELRGDPGDVGIRFWEQTESAFYERLQSIRDLLEDGLETEDERRSWLRSLRRVANQAFESITAVGYFEATHPKRTATAWNGLQRFFNGPRMRERLALPKPEKSPTTGAQA
jgi:CRISPR system Cascade subunit CasA